MTTTQEYNQADGPHRPLPAVLAEMVSKVPAQMEIRAISINGQTGCIIIETYHDLADGAFEFWNT